MPALFSFSGLRSHWGSRLFYDPKVHVFFDSPDGDTHSSQGGTLCPAVTLLQHSGYPQYGLLCLALGGWEEITPIFGNSSARFVAVVTLHVSGGIKISWPLEEGYICLSGLEGEPAGVGATVFTAEPVPVTLSAQTQLSLTAFFEVLGLASAEDIHRFLLNQPDWVLADILPPLLGLWPTDLLKMCAASFLKDAPFCRRLCALLPGGHAYKKALCDLSYWLSSRRPAMAPAQIGEDFDYLDRAVTSVAEGLGRFHPLYRLLGAARRTVLPRYRICLLATACNEGLYFIEWIAYHRALGVEHFFIYSNDNDDGSDALLKSLHDAGVITWVDNRLGTGRCAQAKAYRHALSCLPDILDYRWTAVLDLDEFIWINPEKYHDLADFLSVQDLRKATFCRFYWHLFLTQGLSHWPDAGVSRTIVSRFPELNENFKTISRTSHVSVSDPHQPTAVTDDYVLTLNADGGPASEATDRDGFIAHYHLKSVDEFLWKGNRNPGYEGVERDPPLSRRLRYGKNFVDLFNLTWPVQDRRILEGAPGFEMQRQILLSLPGVAQAFASTRD